ncbi:MAG: RiPP maturation radical SAM C-methyltransferase [Anaerolineales bacterium]|nr:RiPP maturation radical SAM C-methyltransferase [Anaerolineales bacterium]
MDKVLLITMPFSIATQPALGISLLRGALQRQGTACDIRYLQLPFAAQIGLNLYRHVSLSHPSLLLGEWLFAHHLFGDHIPNPLRDGVAVLRQYLTAHDRDIYVDLIDQLPRLRASTGPYLDACVDAVPWEQYDVIGFSSTFAQNTASLTLAQRVKETWPDKTIVFGGANCEGEMGVELHRQFPFVDYVCSGESDLLFPTMIERLASGSDIDDLPGLIYRQDGETMINGSYAPPILDLDALPFPDYDDYITQLEGSGLALGPADIRLVLETSRGCWWGAKSQCTFCGFNGNSMGYRCKSSERVLEEFTYLAQRYPTIKQVDAVDNILDVRFFRDVIPGLIERDLGLDIFYFVKVNMSREQVRQLRQAGIRRITPGIESLDTEILQLMRKGCITTQNVQLLKWAREFGIQVNWLLLSGFPGEPPDAYRRMAEMLPALVHLQPPETWGLSRLRLDRFSPYFQTPEAYGMVNVRPSLAHRFVYPFPEESLARMAYHFDFDYVDDRQPEVYTSMLREALRQWRAQADSGSLLSLRSDERLTLCDTRPGAHQREIVLVGLAKAIYEYCDEGRTLQAILHHLKQIGEPYETEDVQTILDSIVEARVMLYTDDRYLSLAIPMYEPARGFIDSFVSALTLPQND